MPPTRVRWKSRKRLHFVLLTTLVLITLINFHAFFSTDGYEADFLVLERQQHPLRYAPDQRLRIQELVGHHVLPCLSTMPGEWYIADSRGRACSSDAPVSVDGCCREAFTPVAAHSQLHGSSSSDSEVSVPANTSHCAPTHELCVSACTHRLATVTADSIDSDPVVSALRIALGGAPPPTARVITPSSRPTARPIVATKRVLAAIDRSGLGPPSVMRAYYRTRALVSLPSQRRVAASVPHDAATPRTATLPSSAQRSNITLLAHGGLRFTLGMLRWWEMVRTALDARAPPCCTGAARGPHGAARPSTSDPLRAAALAKDNKAVALRVDFDALALRRANHGTGGRRLLEGARVGAPRGGGDSGHPLAETRHAVGNTAMGVADVDRGRSLSTSSVARRVLEQAHIGTRRSVNPRVSDPASLDRNREVHRLSPQRRGRRDGGSAGGLLGAADYVSLSSERLNNDIVWRSLHAEGLLPYRPATGCAMAPALCNFGYCVDVCRTRSGSTRHENTYKDRVGGPYCFGGESMGGQEPYVVVVE